MPRPPYDGHVQAAVAQDEVRRKADRANQQRVQQKPSIPGKRDRYSLGATMASDTPGLYGVGATGGGSLSTAMVHPDYDPVKCRISLHLPGSYVFSANLRSNNTNLDAHARFTMGGGDMDVAALLDHGQAIVGGDVTGVRFVEVRTTCQGIVKVTEMDDYVDLVVDGEWDAEGEPTVPMFTGSLTIVKVA